MNKKDEISITGELKLIIQNNSYPISNLGFDFHHVQLACRYFGYQSGYLYLFKQDLSKDLIYFSINCSKMNNFEKCIINYTENLWLNRIYVPHLYITCIRDEFNCTAIDVTQQCKAIVFAYMKSCYFLCSTDRYLSYEETRTLCDNKLVGISHENEARFVYSMIYSTELDHLKNFKKQLKRYEIPIGT